VPSISMCTFLSTILCLQFGMSTFWQSVIWMSTKEAPKICAKSEHCFHGSMLWSHFPAIFANFLRTNWRFYKKKLCYDPNFAKLAVFSLQKNAKFSPNFFGESIWKNRNIFFRLVLWLSSLPWSSSTWSRSVTIATR
jgi:hypothetical protein